MQNPFPLGDEYLSLPRSRTTWLVEPLLPVGGLVLLYGEPKVGKSFAGLQLALALTSGQPDWLGFPIHRPKPETEVRVAYIQLDTPRSLWAERVDVLRRDGLPIHQVHFADRETLGFFPFDILSNEHAEHLRLSLAQIGPDVVIVDTLRECHSGEENDSTVMRNVVAALQAACAPACLILVSHSRKPVAEGSVDIISDHRGSNYVVGRMDTILHFRRHSLSYVGRAIEGGTVKLDRGDNGLWLPADDTMRQLAEDVLNDPSLGSQRAKASALAAKTGKSEEAMRSLLRRLGVGGSQPPIEAADPQPS